MFKKKQIETMYDDSKVEGFSLEQWQQEPVSGTSIQKLTLNILDPNKHYILVNTCPDLYVGIKGSGLILKSLTDETSTDIFMVKDSSITQLLKSGILTINAYDLDAFMVIWVAINPGAYVAIQSNEDIDLNQVEM